MIIPFAKYHGTGNDFILIDNRSTAYRLSPNEIQKMCHRRFGIGADGLMLLNDRNGYDFEMLYHNADGYPGSMCGNGGRCIVTFAFHLGIVRDRCRFLAVDGVHEAEIVEASSEQAAVRLKLKDVSGIETRQESYFLDTGSDHYVAFVRKIDRFDVFNEGKKIRYHERFAPKGTNVNFVEIFDDHIFVRTYERGVEDETYSCGTGSVASALATSLHTGNSTGICNVKTLGGDLKVHSERRGDDFEKIWLEGPAALAFRGEIEMS